MTRRFVDLLSAVAEPPRHRWSEPLGPIVGALHGRFEQPARFGQTARQAGDVLAQTRELAGHGAEQPRSVVHQLGEQF